MKFTSLSVLAFLVLTSLASAGGTHSHSKSASAGQDSPFVTAVKAAFENGDLAADESDPELTAKQLKGDALAFFKKLTKDNAPDYPAAAELIQFQGKSIILVTDNTDGGSYFGLFTKDGSLIASASQGESGDLHWD